jgi:hypothetical protein
MQFPNPMAKRDKYDLEVRDGLAIKPLILVLQVLTVALKQKDRITFDELAYFVLNSLDSLQGKFSGPEIYSQIIRYRSSGKAIREFHGSRDRQHIKESLSLLVLSNLIQTDGTSYWINSAEEATVIELCSEPANKGLFRNRYANEAHEVFQQEWKKFLTDYSSASPMLLETDVKALAHVPMRVTKSKSRRAANDIGREGELLVLDLENKALKDAFPEQGIEALDYSAKRGIGYDIESVFHKDHTLHGKQHRIEVKSTLRVTRPNFDKNGIPDSFVLTRSEKQAVDIYKESFSIYRVYIFSGGYLVHVLRNPAALGNSGKIRFTPDNWTAEYRPGDVFHPEHIIEVLI